MAGYWLATEGGREYCSALKDAYFDSAAILLGYYRRTNGNIHRIVPDYQGSFGLPIYNSRTGKGFTHAVRFVNGSNPKDGYETVSYSSSYGVRTTGPYKFPRDW